MVRSSSSGRKPPSRTCPPPPVIVAPSPSTFLPFGEVIDDHPLFVDPAVNAYETYCRPAGAGAQNAIAVIDQAPLVPLASSAALTVKPVPFASGVAETNPTSPAAAPPSMRPAPPSTFFPAGHVAVCDLLTLFVAL